MRRLDRRRQLRREIGVPGLVAQVREVRVLGADGLVELLRGRGVSVERVE